MVDSIDCVSISHSGLLIAYGCRDQNHDIVKNNSIAGVIIASMGTKSIVKNFYIVRMFEQIDRIALSPTGSHVAFVSSSFDTFIWNYEMDDNLHELHCEYTTDLVFSPNEYFLATYSSSSGEVKLWYVNNRELLADLSTEAATNYVVFSPDSSQIAIADIDRKILVYCTSTLNLLQTFHTNAVWCMVYSPDGEQIISGDVDGNIKFWDCKTGRLIRELSCGNRAINSLALLHTHDIELD
jgi:WD40 repeat protein